MVKVTKINVISMGKISGALYGFMGLIFGIIFTVITLIGLLLAVIFTRNDVNWWILLFGLGSLILIPIFYGIMGFLMGVIVSAVYNLIAKYVGGLEIELEEKVVNKEETLKEVEEDKA